MHPTRRAFLTRTAALAGMSVILPSRAFGETRRAAANDRITVGGIGLGPRGRQLLPAFLQ